MKSLLRRLGQLGSKSAGHWQRKRRQRSVALIAESPFFDRAWYLQTYPDVRDSGIEAARHYFECGWREGRDPGPDFCTRSYLKANSDVASLGINPLLHYIEHGRFEGRGAPHHGAPFQATFSSEERFGPAAACVRFPVPDVQACSWKRAGRITGAESIGAIDELSVAKFNSEEDRRAFDQALQQLAGFSEHQKDHAGAFAALFGQVLELWDAWNAGAGIFRTRWAPAEQPVVVRAVQYFAGKPLLIGEGAVRNELDIIDAKPANPFYPMLFLFTAADGEFLGARQLTFPALCRGQPHYAELLALSRTAGEMDITSVDQDLATKLFDLRTGAAHALVGRLRVDLGAADGTHLLFDPDFQSWLSRVMCISVAPRTSEAGPSVLYLAEAVTVSASSARATEAAELELASDMIPTISALVADTGVGTPSEGPVAFIAVTSDPNIGRLVKVPVHPAANMGAVEPVLRPVKGADTLGPRRSDLTVLAIRVPPKRPLTEAELLVPHGRTGPCNTAGARNLVSWLILPERSSDGDLSQSLEALAQQTTPAASVIFAGQPSDLVASLAQRLFPGRTRVAAGTQQAAMLIDTPLAGYLGATIVLHDRRTTELLSSALDDADAATVSALVVTTEKPGNGPLMLAQNSGVAGENQLLPLKLVPTAQPPRDFWIAPAKLVVAWAKGGRQDGARHLCSTDVSVSRMRSSEAKPPIVLPEGNKREAVATEALVG